MYCPHCDGFFANHAPEVNVLPDRVAKFFRYGMGHEECGQYVYCPVVMMAIDTSGKRKDITGEGFDYNDFIWMKVDGEVEELLSEATPESFL